MIYTCNKNLFSCALHNVDDASVQGRRVSGGQSQVNYVSCKKIQFI